MKTIKKNEKMIMTEKLANDLMNDLACVAISATGGAIEDVNGNFNRDQMNFAQEYARQVFCSILEAWENQMGQKWNIETR